MGDTAYGRHGVWATRRMGVSAYGRMGDGKRQGRLKTGAAGSQKELHPRRAEFFALPIPHQPKPQPLLALPITAY
ncbi:MAG: hypothetical protein JO170_29000 [Verrucomicrobia bacterium]|nr:hypothetical protein [Verrucomicrobiota bacterium]